MEYKKNFRVKTQSNFPEIKEDLNLLAERKIDIESSTLKQMLRNECLTSKKKNSSEKPSFQKPGKNPHKTPKRTITQNLRPRKALPEWQNNDL